MKESIAHIADQIREAREAKGLSQRVLSQKVGIPQSHISKIENGAVNLQLSSLIELARALDLELMLIPKQATRITQQAVDISHERTSKEVALRKLQNIAMKASPRDNWYDAAQQINNAVKLYKQINLSSQQIMELQRYAREAERSLNLVDRRPAIEKIARLMQNTRNELAHQGTRTYTQQAMFQLDEES